jgi:dihydrofolate reductase
MKVSLYNAISIDGFIANKKDDTSWVSETDWGEFSRIVKEKRAIIMGRKTFEHAHDDFPFECDLNIVVTKDKKLISQHNEDEGVWFTNKSPKEILKELEKNGYEECLLIGGGVCNALFLDAGLIDEVIVSVHPLILGDGVRLFESKSTKVKLEKKSVKELDEGLLQVVYKVK